MGNQYHLDEATAIMKTPDYDGYGRLSGNFSEVLSTKSL